MVIQTEKFDSGIVVLKLKQSGGNKFTPEMLSDLDNKLEKFTMDNAKGLILTGSGNSFSVGGDLKGMYEAMENNKPEAYVEEVVPIVNRIIKKIISHELPVIAALNGSAAGGGLSLALACDYIISVEGAKLSMAFGKLALSPDSCSTITFVRKFGRSLALKGIATGAVYTAVDAERIGAIDRIVSSEDLISASKSMILELTSESSWSFAKTKYLLNQDVLQIIEKQSIDEFHNIVESSKRQEYQEKLRKMLTNLGII